MSQVSVNFTVSVDDVGTRQKVQSGTQITVGIGDLSNGFVEGDWIDFVCDQGTVAFLAMGNIALQYPSLTLDVGDRVRLLLATDGVTFTWDMDVTRAPVAQAPATVINEVWQLTGTTDGDFTGSLFNSWSAFQPFVNSTQYLSWSQYENLFTVVGNPGNYAIEIQGAATPNGNWPDGPTAYGTELVTTDASVLGNSNTVAVRYVSTANGDSNGTLNAGNGINLQVSTWSDCFMIGAQTGNRFSLQNYAFAYDGGPAVQFTLRINVRKLT